MERRNIMERRNAAVAVADCRNGWNGLTIRTKKELNAVRLSAQRGRPLGDDVWVESIATRLNLESTIRPRGRQQLRSEVDTQIKDA